MGRPTKSIYLVAGFLIALLLLFFFFTSKDYQLKKELPYSSWDLQTSDLGSGKLRFYENTAELDLNGEQLSGRYRINSFVKKIEISTKNSIIEISIDSNSKEYTSLTGALNGVKGTEKSGTSLLLTRTK